MTVDLTPPRAPLEVLVVDDSAIVRQVIGTILRHEGISVTVAGDPILAMSKMSRVRPDVIVLDLEMPRMDGITFLRRVMREDPIPVIVCSALTGEGTDEGLRAMDEGAVAIIRKPQLDVRGFLTESAVHLVETVRTAARTRVFRRHLAPGPRLTADAVLPPPRGAIDRTTDKVVVVGASTGGTEAIRVLLQSLPPDCPGLVVVQHMPEVFTAAFAARLDGDVVVSVKEAKSGDRIMRGRVLIAPGNRHTILQRSGAQYGVDVIDGPLVSRHRPSVDVLFRSAAKAAGRNALGVILTGMGDDGASGMVELKRSGAVTIAQDEATSVVFGMPKEAISRGAIDHVLPLGQIASAIVRNGR